jgi:hypothetical protein
MNKNKTTLENMSVRNYLDQTIMATLYEGLRKLVRERPENPFEFLAFYLLKQDPTHKYCVENLFGKTRPENLDSSQPSLPAFLP